MVFRPLVHALAAPLLAVLALAAGPAGAAPYLETAYDPAVPTLEQVVGHESGDRVTRPDQILVYLEALQAAAPDRVRIVDYARSWEGRRLVYALIGSPTTIARLDALRANMARLAAGEALSPAERQALIADTPAVAWLSFGVHGDEISPPDSALALAHHLLAARGDAVVDAILANTLVVIDPSQNPDGRNRFTNSFEAALGLEPQGDRFTAEHDQPWPRGRTNHYLFDLNRDWFALTQPETRGKVAAIQQWNPVLYVDSHEMGGDGTYFFPPSANPINPNITDGQRAMQQAMGRARAAWFDRLGIPYFTREVYDAFYPGYGDMWPTLNGAIAKTFEQASARGLVFDQRDGDTLTYRDGVRNNFIASLATLEAVAANRERMLAAFADYRRSAVVEGAGSAERFAVIDLAQRRWQAESLARRLAYQGIRVQRVGAGAALCGARYPAGALVIDRAQPTGRLIKTLLDPDTALPADFVRDQEARRDRGLDHELYDVTAWSLPLMDGLAMRRCAKADLAGASPLAANDPIPALGGGSAAFGYAVPWSDGGQARLVVAALRDGLRGSTTDEAFTKDGRTYPMGSVIFPRAGNPDDLEQRLTGLARDIGAEIVPLDSSWVEDGPNFGSASFATLKAPKVALGWGEGTGSNAAGETRYVLERQLGLPVAPIRLSTLGQAELDRYDVLVLPEAGGGMGSQIGAGGRAAIKAFAERGGVVIGIGSALDWMAGKDVALLATRRENAFVDEAVEDAQKDAKADDEGAAKGTRIAGADEYAALITDTEAQPDDLPGALVRVEAETDHWLASGYDRAVALAVGTRIYRPLGKGDGVNVFRFVDAPSLLASGYLWEENRLQMAFKPFVMAQPKGDGLVIGFTQSPFTRAYLNDLALLVANAVVLAPARVR